MKTSFGRIAGLTLIGSTLLASPFADAATPLPKPEKSLLGIRLMSTFKDVLKKFGQPDEIQIGSPAPPQKASLNPGQTAAAPSGFGGMAAPGGMMGGRPMGMGGAMMSGSMGGGGKMGAMMGGRPPGMGSLMGGSMGGGPSMSGYGAMSGMMGRGGSMGGMGGGRLPGFAMGGRKGGDDGSGGSLPGFPGAMMGGGGSMGGAAMMPGASGGGMSGGAAADEPTGESTWWFHVKGKKGQNVGLHYSFLFNKEGKVIQIQQYGYTGGGKTIQGVGLGSTLGQVLGKYGMSNEGSRAGEMAQMIYGGGEQVVFQLLRNRVIGVTLAVTK